MSSRMMKSWADHCSSDEESDDGLHPARLAAASGDDDEINNNDGDLSFGDEESIEHISVTGDDNLDDLVGGGNYNKRGGSGGRNNNNNNNRRNNNEDIPYPPPIDFDNLPPDIPTQAPFTAFIKNLSYKIDSPTALAEKIEGLTRWRYKKRMEVKVVNARLGMDQRTGKCMGYGYVEFETANELMIFLNLNDGFSSLNGRIIIIDVAHSRGPNKQSHNKNNTSNRTQRQSSSGSDIDGTQFRGGRYANRNTHNNANHNNANGGGLSSGGGGSVPAATERPTLKLAPRTKPVEEAGRSTSNSSIFGDAKPRDEQSWRKKKEEEENQESVVAVGGEEKEKDNVEEEVNGKQESTSDHVVDKNEKSNIAPPAPRGGTDRANANSSGRGRGGKGGGSDRRQRGKGGRGGGGGDRNNNRKNNNDRKNNNNNNQSSGKDEDGWEKGKSVSRPQAAVPKPVEEQKEVKKVTKVANSFAALGFDSDSD